MDIVKPGDRVKCAGIYRALVHSRMMSGVFRTGLFANSLTKSLRDDASVGLTPGDIENINITVSPPNMTIQKIISLLGKRAHI